MAIGFRKTIGRVGTCMALKAKLGTLCGKLVGGVGEAMTICWLRVQKYEITVGVIPSSAQNAGERPIYNP